MMTASKTVVIGLSGGVDSSVSALLLKEQGYRVIGLFMKNWEEVDEHGVCCAAADYADVQRVCDQLDIPHYTVNFVEAYREQVFTHFLADLQRGLTPNPDILCNREIKFKVFLDKAKALGADFLATGHYAQIGNSNDAFTLERAADTTKDQTYFLYTLNSHILAQVLFPIGHLNKTEVRAKAHQFGLVTAAKKDSTGICFIGKRDFRTFLSQHIAYQPGTFQTLAGKIMGRHEGAFAYTLGQRRGLGIGGPGEAWFVVAKDIEQGIVFVEQGDDHPALYCDNLLADEISWVNNPPSLPFTCTAKVRYRQADQICTIVSQESGAISVQFAVPQRAVTPGQSIVFYAGNVCLGGGVIRHAKKKLNRINSIDQ